MQYIIHIPNWNPPSVNKLLRGHWGNASRIKSGATQMIHAYAYNMKIPKATGKRKVEMVVTQSKGRSLDPDNLYKVLNDSLVRLGYLKDDGDKWLENSSVILKRGKKSTTITISEVE